MTFCLFLSVQTQAYFSHFIKNGYTAPPAVLPVARKDITRLNALCPSKCCPVATVVPKNAKDWPAPMIKNKQILNLTMTTFIKCKLSTFHIGRSNFENVALYFSFFLLWNMYLCRQTALSGLLLHTIYLTVKAHPGYSSKCLFGNN